MDHLHHTSDNYTAVEEFNLAEALMNGYDLLLMGEPSFVMTPLLCHRDNTIHIPTDNRTAIELSPPWLLTHISCYCRYVKLSLASLYLGDLNRVPLLHIHNPWLSFLIIPPYPSLLICPFISLLHCALIASL